jgi:AGCS family alanine or glycine:cation symporter
VLALTIMVINIDLVPEVLSQIFRAAFGLDEAIAGTVGGITAAMMNGAKRGLFSNEAGMGSAPNAAATATVAHPARQGLIQSLGVFVDTMIVCSSTAFIVLCSGIYMPGVTSSEQGATLTQDAVASVLGDWTIPMMTFLIFVFAFTSVLGNYSYAEVNLELLTGSKVILNVFRVLVCGAVVVGGMTPLTMVWSLADVAMACMALVNLVAILLLGNIAFVVIRDWERQHKAGLDPIFVLDDHPELAGRVDTDIWSRAAQEERPLV